MAKASESAGKLTQREYAAIHLAVPDSGTVWLDEMIKKSAKYTVPLEELRNEAPPQGPKNPPKGGAGKKIA